MLELLTALLSKTYNMDEAGVKELLLKKSEGGEFTDEIADGALDKLLSMDAERVAGYNAKTKSIQENFYKKGKQEALSDLEKSLRGAKNKAWTLFAPLWERKQASRWMTTR